MINTVIIEMRYNYNYIEVLKIYKYNVHLDESFKCLYKAMKEGPKFLCDSILAVLNNLARPD